MGVAPTIQHRPVMEQDICALLLHDRPAIHVDCTLGGGGHTRALLHASSVPNVVIGLDRDAYCIAAAQHWGAPWGARFVPVQGDFRDLATLLAQFGYAQVDGILFDLGVSSYQLDTASRGFSFRLMAPSTCAWILPRRTRLRCWSIGLLPNICRPSFVPWARSAGPSALRGRL